MADNFVVTSASVSADVISGGTLDFPYPAGVAAEDLEGGDPEQVILIIDGSNRVQGSEYVTVAYGASITATNVYEGAVWRAGQSAMLQVPRKPLYSDAEDVVDQISAVLGACAAIAALDPAADLPTTVGKVNEIITALKTT